MKDATIPELLAKLDGLYDKEEQLKKVLMKATMEFEQLQEDKELLQNVIMHQSNKKARHNGTT